MNSTTEKSLPDTILRVIREELYPLVDFPRASFPDLETILSTVLRGQFRHSSENESTKSPALPSVERAKEILQISSLLKNQPTTVISLYRTMITRFVRFKHRCREEWEDIIQEIITRLLTGRIHRIAAQYDDSLRENRRFTSYFFISIRNLYIDILREGKIVTMKECSVQLADMKEIPACNRDPGAELILEKELDKLNSIFILFARSGPKLILLLKLKYRFTIRSNDVSGCFPRASTADIETLCQGFQSLTDQQMFTHIIPIFNRLEGNNKQADSLRKWIDLKIDEIIAHMNSLHIAPLYQRRNVSELIGYFFQSSEGAHD